MIHACFYDSRRGMLTVRLPLKLQDASDAISQLARRGNANCHIPYAGGASLVKYGLAEIYGVTVNKHGSILPW
jgi:hypothetical protein